MKPGKIILLLIALIQPVLNVCAQIDSVFVEKYYISDTYDSTNITGGKLVAGSVTYRVYIDLAEGSKLYRLYGDDNHEVAFNSTDIFFNNNEYGKTFGKEIRSDMLDNNTAALDSWITLGVASDTQFGVIKEEDPDGSTVGGINNDGGSAFIPGGLLVNADPEAGIPLTASDGLVTASAGTFPSSWITTLNGEELTSETDYTIFGNLIPGNSFSSNDFSIFCYGISGPTVNNRVLLAQLTTRGELSFKLNVEIEEQSGSSKKRVSYVAENPINGEKTNRFLIYPAAPPPPVVCGCNDPDYLEFKDDLDCIAPDSCKTVVVFGCTDPMACNFDSDANFNVPSLCCYPGKCNGRDISVVCPDIKGNELAFSLYPNPAKDIVTIDISKGNQKEVHCIIYDSNGTILFSESLGGVPDQFSHQISVSGLFNGLFFLRLSGEDRSVTKAFIKN
jgi:hypothetical protein